MSRKTPVPQADIALGKRLAQLRRRRLLSRGDLAKRSGVAAGVITRVELGRMPLAYADARLVLSSFVGGECPEMVPISPLWLAYGEGPEQLRWPLFLPENGAIGLGRRASFMDFANANTRLLIDLVSDAPLAQLPESWLGPYLSQWGRITSNVMLLEHGIGLLERVFVFSTERLAATSAEAKRLLAEYEKSCGLGITKKYPLTHVSVSVKQPGVKSLFGNFLDRLNEATARRGMKSVLADYLGVPLASVSQWLSGEREPGGETTLKLLKWVEKHERQQYKSHDSAVTLPRPKARKHASSYENKKPSPRKQ